MPAEKALLGGLIKSDVVFWQLQDVLRPDHFSNAIHSQIYSAIRDICIEGKRVSLTLLGSRLPPEDDSGKSMAAYLAVLVAGSEDAGNPIDYVDQIVSAWARRKLIEAAAKIDKAAKAGAEAVPDILADATTALMDISQGSESEPEKPLKAVLARAVEKANVAHQNEGSIPGIDTGLPSLDEICGRFMPGDLIFAGGSQGDAKTALATQIALRAGREYGPVLFFEMEMRDEDLARRILAAESGISVSAIEEGAFNFREFERLVESQKALDNVNLLFDDRPRLKAGQIRAKALSVKRARGHLALVVVDHLRLVQPDTKVKDIFERIEYVTGSLKALAKELNAPVLCLAQRTRDSQKRDDPTPQVNDFFGGGSIEQDADIIIAPWRRDIWLKQRVPRQSEEKRFAEWLSDLRDCEGKIDVITLKRRRGSAMEKRRFIFNGAATRLEELSQ